MRSVRPLPLSVPRLLTLMLLALLATASPPLASPAIRATPVALDLADRAHVRLGALRYLGGWELASNDQRFGGLSAMIWRGGRLIALSDAGTIFSIGIVAGLPAGRVLRDLPAGPGTGASKGDRDTESLTTDPETGRMWAGFEGFNQIWRYDAAFAAAEQHAAPRAMSKWPINGGPEAMVRLADGRFLIFSEEARGPEGGTTVLIFPGDPTAPGATPLIAGYRAPAGYRITDAAVLPDGRLLLLHRRFSLMEGLSAIVAVLDPAAIRPNHAVAPREIARLASPLTVDNMEAIALTQEAGRTIVWIGSDDNFSPLQRTLLLKFALIDDVGADRHTKPAGARAPAGQISSR